MDEEDDLGLRTPKRLLLGGTAVGVEIGVSHNKPYHNQDGDVAHRKRKKKNNEDLVQTKTLNLRKAVQNNK